jgi:hypothetical protein
MNKHEKYAGSSDIFSNNYNTAGRWQLCQEMPGEPWTSADEPQSLLRRTQRTLME